MNAEQTFRSKSSGIVAKLMGDFPIRPEHGFAIVGNAGHECNGFTTLQEMRPTVPGSRGGWGWMQWTGPRRRAFEAYCKRNNLDPASDQANYAWLFLELKGAEAKAIPAVLGASGVEGRVKAFEKAFLRAGVKHYPSRTAWTQKAAQQWQVDGQAPAPLPVAKKREILVDEAGASKERSNQAAKGAGGAGAGGLGTGGATQVVEPNVWADLFLFGLLAGCIGLFCWLGFRAIKQRRAAKRLIDEAAALIGVADPSSENGDA
jgi:hypothetical protein